jgi:hypothetical protein
MLGAWRARAVSAFGFGVLSAVAGLAACGGGGSSSKGFSSDGGGTGEDGNMTTEAGSSSGSSSGGISGSSSGSMDATAPSDSGSGGKSDSGDAAFLFDGFGAPDSTTDGPLCLDDDNDGWTTCAGDCNDHDSQINPCAFDTNDPTDPVGTDGIDNDCDGYVDNLITCESSLPAGSDYNPVDHANAANVCDNPKCPRLVGSKAIWYGPSPMTVDRSGRAIEDTV